MVLYRKSLGACVFLMGFIFTLGSLSFNVFLPYGIGKLIKLHGTADYDNKVKHLLITSGIFLGSSAVCEFIRQLIFNKNAKTLSKKLRYDMYYSYFQKLKIARIKSSKSLTHEIDEAQCKKHFDFKTVESNILVFEEEISKYAPLKMKSFWLTFACLVALFIISWQLSLMLTIGGAILGLIYGIT